ncbi:unnamed protein product [Orchesella dallaii]|uniref:N-alpha-acetyltransferase 20 n=1 Tax=Orchesella dallaii TaxID=48710 RepID=A0ABP1PNS5_9HEXA
MTSLKPFTCADLFRFNKVNFDPLTETYGLSFYMTYMARWPDYFKKIENTKSEVVGYIMGKAEGIGENWHGHVTCLTVAEQYRRQGLAAKLMRNLEETSEHKRCYFVDLFVRVTNCKAIRMYESLGYIVYRTVLDYYSGDPDENAFGMNSIMALMRQINNVERKMIFHIFCLPYRYAKGFIKRRS